MSFSSPLPCTNEAATGSGLGGESTGYALLLGSPAGLEGLGSTLSPGTISSSSHRSGDQLSASFDTSLRPVLVRCFVVIRFGAGILGGPGVLCAEGAGGPTPRCRGVSSRTNPVVFGKGEPSDLGWLISGALRCTEQDVANSRGAILWLHWMEA